MDTLTEIGVGGIFAVLLIKQVFDFLLHWKGSKNTDGDNLDTDSKKIDKILSMTREMYSMHIVKDGDGAPIWYYKKSLEVVIKELSDRIRTLGSLLDKQLNRFDNLDEKIKSIHENIEELKKS